MRSFLYCALLMASCKEQPVEQPGAIEEWFDEGAKNCDISKDLHFCSQWKYLTTEQFKELVLDSINKLNPPINDNESVFDLGMGVGAALQVIKQHKNNITIGGSDISKEAINVAKRVFPSEADNFFVHDMVKKHKNIADDSFDHVISLGALAMYLTKDQMIEAIKEAKRMVKPGGSMVFSSFIEPSGQNVGSIVDKVEKSFWAQALSNLGLEEIQIHGMLNQGDRYQLSCRKPL